MRLLPCIGLGFPNNTLVPSLGWYGRPYLYQLVASLPFSLDCPLYALALVGVGVALWKQGATLYLLTAPFDEEELAQLYLKVRTHTS